MWPNRLGLQNTPSASLQMGKTPSTLVFDMTLYLFQFKMGVVQFKMGVVQFKMGIVQFKMEKLL